MVKKAKKPAKKAAVKRVMAKKTVVAKVTKKRSVKSLRVAKKAHTAEGKKRKKVAT